jgi:Flp pilus assembly protein TadD
VPLPAELVARLSLETAEALARKGHLKEAIALYEQARQQGTSRVDYCWRMALLYDRLGDDKKAAEEYQRAYQLYPQDARLACDVGYFHYTRGSWQDAECWLRHAIKLAPAHQKAWVNLGLVLANQERFDESLTAFKQVVAPGQAHSNLGVLLARLGRHDEARTQLREALRLNPDLRQARISLDLIDRPKTAPAIQQASYQPEQPNMVLMESLMTSPVPTSGDPVTPNIRTASFTPQMGRPGHPVPLPEEGTATKTRKQFAETGP